MITTAHDHIFTFRGPSTPLPLVLDGPLSGASACLLAGDVFSYTFVIYITDRKVTTELHIADFLNL